MAVPANTFQTYPQVNIREDLANVVYNVDPYVTPLLNMAKRVRAKQDFHEWNTDALDAQDLNNAQIDGDDASNDSVTPSVRLGNYTQISTKTVGISGTSQAVVAAGGTNKMGYQLLKKSKSLKRDMEGILTNNVVRSAGSTNTARKTAGLPCWLVTNPVFQTGGAPSGANPTSGDGTHTRTYNSVKAAITEDMLDEMQLNCFVNSGECPEYVLTSAKNKQAISKFSGPGTRFTQVEDRTLRTSFDFYDGDFGRMKIVPDLFLATSGDCYGINKQYVRVAYLRPFQTIPLAKTGDSDRKMLLVEYGLEVGNEKAIGAIFDTTG